MCKSASLLASTRRLKSEERRRREGKKKVRGGGRHENFFFFFGELQKNPNPTRTFRTLGLPIRSLSATARLPANHVALKSPLEVGRAAHPCASFNPHRFFCAEAPARDIGSPVGWRSSRRRGSPPSEQQLQHSTQGEYKLSYNTRLLSPCLCLS